MGRHRVMPCRGAGCGRLVFFAPTEKGKRGIFDAEPVPNATERTQRAWLDEAGVAHFVAKDRPAPEGKPTYTNHWLTCCRASDFADERLGGKVDGRLAGKPRDEAGEGR